MAQISCQCTKSHGSLVIDKGKPLRRQPFSPREYRVIHSTKNLDQNGQDIGKKERKIQDYNIMLKLGCPDQSFYEMSAVDEFHISPFIFARFGQFSPF